jgi:hypothetical protein
MQQQQCRLLVALLKAQRPQLAQDLAHSTDAFFAFLTSVNSEPSECSR